MKTRGNIHPRYFRRGAFYSRIALLFVLCVLNFKPALAQEMPVLNGVSPREGYIGEQLTLVLDGTGLFQLDNLTNINFGDVQIPFSNYEIIDDQTAAVSVSIPEQSPIGKQMMMVFTFDNEFHLEAPFIVLESAGPAQGPPFLNGISPREGHPGEQLHIVLDGGGFSRLGELRAVKVSGVDAPLLDYNLVSDQTFEVLVRIPEDASTGEGDISFSFENGDLGSPFVVLEPAEPPQVAPLLYGVSPQEGRPGEQLPITLDGGGLSFLGALRAVNIRGVDIPILDYNLVSDESLKVLIRLPEDVPPGEGDISFAFDNGDLSAYFIVNQPGAPPPVEPASAAIRVVSPQEGRVDSGLSLRLNGDNLSLLGDLQSVDINGRDIPIVNYQVVSDQTIEALLNVPADTPSGDGQISFFFDNSTFEAPFTLLAATPPPRIPVEVIVAVVLVAGALGFIGRGLFRKPKPQDKGRVQKPHTTPPEFHFKTHLEPGSQTIETTGPSVKADFDIRLTTTTDYGVQYIEVEQDSLTAE